MNQILTNCHFSGLAQSAYKRVSPLRDCETGILIGAPFERFYQQGYPNRYLPLSEWRPGRLVGRFKSLAPDPLATIYAVTYFDRVVWAAPANPIFGQLFAAPSELQRAFLELGAIETLPLILEGSVDNLSAFEAGIALDTGATIAFETGQRLTIEGLLARDGQGWTLGNAPFRSVVRNPKKLKDGIVLRVLQGIPVVSEVKDPEAFLRWKEERSEQRRAVQIALTSLAERLQEEGATPDEILAEAEKVRMTCEDLIRVSRERFPSIVFRPVEFSFNADEAAKGARHGHFIGKLLSGLSPEYQDLFEFCGGIGGALRGLSIKGGPAFAQTLVEGSPWAAVIDLQYAK